MTTNIKNDAAKKYDEKMDEGLKAGEVKAGEVKAGEVKAGEVKTKVMMIKVMKTRYAWGRQIGSWSAEVVAPRRRAATLWPWRSPKRYTF
jgi:hypothetical protein